MTIPRTPLAQKPTLKILAHCIAGLQDVVAAALHDSILPDLRINSIEDGAVLYETTASLRDIARIGFTNNQFLILDEAPSKAKGLTDFLYRLAHRTGWQDDAETLPQLDHPRHFRLVVSDENQLVSIESAVTRPLIDILSRLTGLEYSPRGADREFWAIRRRSGVMFFCQRLTMLRRTERDLDPGELRPELAELMCRLSDPRANDVFMDPLAGSGAIGFARAQFPYNMMFLSDIDPVNIQRIKNSVKAGKLKEKKSSPVIIRIADARILEKIQDGFVDTIVTDPPWGFFDKKIGDMDVFYEAVLHTLCRVVKAGGVIVMLLGRRDLADRLIMDFNDQLGLESRFDILVSGKKAVIVKWRSRIQDS